MPALPLWGGHATAWLCQRGSRISFQDLPLRINGGFPKLGVPFKGGYGGKIGLYRDNGKENGSYYLRFRV